MGHLPLPIAAFVAGLASFLTPCVLPLVPGYVSLISGVGIEELKAQQASVLRKVMLNSIAFIIGFSIVFVTLGALSTAVGQLASQYKSLLAHFMLTSVYTALKGQARFGVPSSLASHLLSGGRRALGQFSPSFSASRRHRTRSRKGSCC